MTNASYTRYAEALKILHGDDTEAKLREALTWLIARDEQLTAARIAAETGKLVAEIDQAAPFKQMRSEVEDKARRGADEELARLRAALGQKYVSVERCRELVEAGVRAGATDDAQDNGLTFDEMVEDVTRRVLQEAGLLCEACDGRVGLPGGPAFCAKCSPAT